MKTIATKQQLFELYVADGMPDIYAYMAAQEDTGGFIKEDAYETLWGSFVWDDSKLGHDFWMGVVMELDPAK
jgi:hypothetical protein